MPQFKEPVSFGEGLYRALTGKSPRSEGKTHGAWARDAVKNLGGAGRGGGVRKLAERMGVAPSTVRKWMRSTSRTGKGISEENKSKLKQAQRAARITPGRAARFRGSMKKGADGSAGGGLVITGIIVVSEDVRERTIHLGHYLPPAAADKVIGALINGGLDAAAQVLSGLIGQHYCQGMRLDAVTDIGW